MLSSAFRHVAYSPIGTSTPLRAENAPTAVETVAPADPALVQESHTTVTIRPQASPAPVTRSDALALVMPPMDPPAPVAEPTLPNQVDAPARRMDAEAHEDDDELPPDSKRNPTRSEQMTGGSVGLPLLTRSDSPTPPPAGTGDDIRQEVALRDSKHGSVVAETAHDECELVVLVDRSPELLDGLHRPDSKAYEGGGGDDEEPADPLSFGVAGLPLDSKSQPLSFMMNLAADRGMLHSDRLLLAEAGKALPPAIHIVVAGYIADAPDHPPPNVPQRARQAAVNAARWCSDHSGGLCCITISGGVVGAIVAFVVYAVHKGNSLYLADEH
jgi:hypothetical protein